MLKVRWWELENRLSIGKEIIYKNKWKIKIERYN